MTNEHNSRKKIGIITGSGPEAGIDLWQKILDENKSLLKQDFKGDLNAPYVSIESIPSLGISMELDKTYDEVWVILEKAIKDICQRVDYFVIACNTLNVYEEEITHLGYKDKFLSTLDVVKLYIEENNLNKIALIGAKPVIEMKKYSVFQSLNQSFDIEVPKDFNKVQTLIYDVKLFGGNDSKVLKNYEEILNDLHCEDVFLACTELPLIGFKSENKNLIDVTQLLAKRVVELSLK